MQHNNSMRLSPYIIDKIYDDIMDEVYEGGL